MDVSLCARRLDAARRVLGVVLGSLRALDTWEDKSSDRYRRRRDQLQDQADRLRAHVETCTAALARAQDEAAALARQEASSGQP